MGFDVEVAQVGTPGQLDRQGRPSLGRATPPGEQEGDRAQPRGLPRERFIHGRRKLGRSVVVEQQQQTFAGGGDGLSALEARLEKRLGSGHGIVEPGTRHRAPRTPLLLEQRLDVGGVLDPLVAVVAAAVPGDLARGVEDAHRGLGGAKRERTAHRGRRNRVVVEVEADVDGLRRADGDDQLRLEGVGGQAQQLRPLLLEGLGDRLAIVRGPAPDARDLIAPHERLAVEVLDGRKRARGEERIAHVAHGPLDGSLLAASPGPGRSGRKVVVRGELEQAGVEAHSLAVAGEHSRAKVVVEAVPARPLEVREGVDVAAQEVLQRLVQEEAQEEPPREGERQHEGRQRTARRPDPHLPEAGPVDLRFFPGEGAPAQERLVPVRPQRAHFLAHLPYAQRTASLAQHVPQPRRRQPRIPLERLAHEAHVRVEQAQPRPGRRPRPLAQCPLHRLVVQPQLLRDRSHPPVLGVVQVPDPCDGLDVDHPCLPPVSR